MNHEPVSDYRDDGALASAYLAGDLDDTAVEAIEARLERDPQFAALLDAAADMLVALRRVDQVPPPSGFGDRLSARIDEEAASSAVRPAAAQATTRDSGAHDGGARVLSLDRRARRAWRAVGTVAAALAAVALIGTGVINATRLGGADSADIATGGDEDSSRMATLESADSQADAPMDMDDSGQDGGGLESGSSADVAEESTLAGPPTVVDSEAVVDDESDLAAQYAALPETAALLGEPVDPLREHLLAAAAGAPRFSSGADPNDCMPAEARTGSAAPARIESLVFAGQPAIAYVLVYPSADGMVFEQADAVVVDAFDCSVLASAPLPAEAR